MQVTVKVDDIRPVLKSTKAFLRELNSQAGQEFKNQYPAILNVVEDGLEVSVSRRLLSRHLNPIVSSYLAYVPTLSHKPNRPDPVGVELSELLKELEKFGNKDVVTLLAMNGRLQIINPKSNEDLFISVPLAKARDMFEDYEPMPQVGTSSLGLAEFNVKMLKKAVDSFKKAFPLSKKNDLYCDRLDLAFDPSLPLGGYVAATDSCVLLTRPLQGVSKVGGLSERFKKLYKNEAQTDVEGNPQHEMWRNSAFGVSYQLLATVLPSMAKECGDSQTATIYRQGRDVIIKTPKQACRLRDITLRRNAYLYDFVRETLPNRYAQYEATVDSKELLAILDEIKAKKFEPDVMKVAYFPSEEGKEYTMVASQTYMDGGEVHSRRVVREVQTMKVKKNKTAGEKFGCTALPKSYEACLKSSSDYRVWTIKQFDMSGVAIYPHGICHVIFDTSGTFPLALIPRMYDRNSDMYDKNPPPEPREVN